MTPGKEEKIFPITRATSLTIGDLFNINKHASFTLSALSGVSVMDIVTESIINPNTTSLWEGINRFFWVN